MKIYLFTAPVFGNPDCATHQAVWSRNPKGKENSDAADMRAAVEAALPEAARLRIQSQLAAEAWNVPTMPFQCLGKPNSVALGPKRELPEVIDRIGLATCSLGTLITEEPDNLGLQGYERCQVHKTIARWLVQLGFGQPVEQRMLGPQINMYVIVRKLQLKLPQEYGFPALPLPGALKVQQLETLFPPEAIAEVVCGANDTATFMRRVDYVQVLLKASGRGGVLCKRKETTAEYFLLYLDEKFSLEEANKVAESDAVWGVVRKGGGAKPRFAVRYAKEIISSSAKILFAWLEVASKLKVRR